MQYPNYDTTADIEVINGNIKKLVQNAEEQDAQIKSKEPAIGEKNSGFNKVKTDLVENDTNKVFSAKGAFDLKSWLVTNYTTLMNNIRDTLTNMINLKLPHGGYNGSGQQLKNEIDTKANRSGDTFTGPLKVHSTLSLLIGNVLSFNSENGGIGWGVWERQNDGSLVFATRSGIGDYGEVLKIQANNHLISQGEFYALGGHKVYHPLNKPTPEALGLGNVNNTADSTKEVLSATKLKTPRTINGTDFDGSKPITTASWGSTRTFTIGKQSRTVNGSGDVNWPLRDIGAIDRNGDTISSRLNMSLYGGQLGFGVGEGANFRMYADIHGNFNINSYRDNGDTIRIQGFRMNHESGEITIDNGSLPLIETIRKQRTDLDFLGANKLDRTNGTYNGFLNFPLDGHGITFNNGSGLGYKIYEHGSSGGLRFEVTTNGAPSGQFAYLNGGANGKILTEKDCPYPVGGIYMTSSSTNPATIWPGTTWNRILGKVIVGVDEGQGEFNIVNKEGGSKYHTLSINEIPSHNHLVRRSNANGSGGLGTVGGNDSPDSWNPSGYTGGGQAHNNLQPYVTKYIWERTR